MLERIVGMATPRTGGVSARARSAASVAIPALAVVHHGAGTPDLSGGTLSAQVLGSPHLAARSVQVV